MTAHLSRRTGSEKGKIGVQETTFSLDILGRFVCNTWEEATVNPCFDAVVIGAGMYGAYCADKIYRSDAGRRLRVLVLEAGSFLLPEHVQNLPNITLFAPSPIEPSTDTGHPRNLVWGMPWRGNHPFVGLPYCVGGKSLFWGGWSPRLTEADLAQWPAEVAQYLRTHYPLLERQTGIAYVTDFIQGALYEALRNKAAAVAESVPALQTVESPPLAVMATDPASGCFAFNKFSSVPLLIGAIRDAIDEAGGDDRIRRLFLVPKAHVVKLHTREGAVRQIEVSVNGQRRFLPIAPTCAVVLAASAIESTRLALESFPTTTAPREERMGRNLMAHLRTNVTVRIRRSALETPDTPLPVRLQTAALLIRGETPDGRFHIQLTAADDPNGNSDALLFRMVPDMDQLDTLLDAQRADCVSLTLRGFAEMRGERERIVHDPCGRWIDLSPFERDEYGMRRAYVYLTLTAAERRLWDAMDQAAYALARKLANDDPHAIEYIYDNAGHQTPPPPEKVRDGLGTTYHESGTLWMGEDPVTSITDVNGRFHHIVNAYCADQALFPTVGSANPVLTGLVLARKVAEAIVCRGTALPVTTGTY